MKMLSRKTRSQTTSSQAQYNLNPQAGPAQSTVVLGKREVSAAPEMDGLKRKRAILTDITNKSSSFAKVDAKGKCSEGSLTKKSKHLLVTKSAAANLKTVTVKASAFPLVVEDKHNETAVHLPMVVEEAVMVPAKPYWRNVDSDSLNDPYHVGLYASDIFTYNKQRELKFLISDYTRSQSDITVAMRAILADWLVEVQEKFALNHETLYIAVKLVDQHLHRHRVSKENLQLVGATAMFIACKFEERSPPVLDDFLYICDDSFNRNELIAMEQKILIGRDFDLGIPLSYSFLRRYAKCAQVSIETLTLARFVLETSLMDVRYVTYRDSHMAAACLWLAMRMKSEGQWDDTMVHYTGYNYDSLISLVKMLNDMLLSPPFKQLTTIRSKYSHVIFHEVAKIPPLSNFLSLL